MITISNLTKKYGETGGLSSLSLTVRKGEIVGLLGKKGSGKTTAMDLISGCIPADSGSIQIGGCDMAADEYAVKAKLGYAPAQPGVYGDMTVRRGMKYIADMRSVPSRSADSQIDSIIHRFAIKDIADVPGGNLSRASRSVVGMAQALIGDVEAVLVDEPTAGLDPKATVQIRDALLSMKEDYAILITTENLTEAMKLCDRVYLLDGGRVVAEGAPDSLADAKGRGSTMRVTVLGDEPTLKNALSGLKVISLSGSGGQATASVAASPEALGKALLAAKLPVIMMEPEPISLHDLLLDLNSERLSHEKGADHQ